MAQILRNNPAEPRRTDSVDTVDVASDGRKSAAQERIRTDAKRFLAEQRTCVSEALYEPLERRVVEMLASQAIELMDLHAEFARIREEVLSRSRISAAELAREESLAKIGLRSMPDRYAPPEVYFDLDTPTVSAIRRIERDLGLAIMPALASYQQRIESTLVLPQDGTMPPEKLETLKASVRSMARAEVAKLPEVAKERLEKSGNGEIDRRDRWIVNDSLKESFGVIERSVLPSARYAILMTSPAYRGAIEESPQYKNDILTRGHVAGRAMDAESAFFGPADTEEVPNGLMHHDGIMKRATIGDDLDAGDRFLERISPAGRPDLRIGSPQPVEFLSEADSRIERKATLWFIGAVALQVTPVVGGVMSVGVDAEDIFSSEDATMNWLKRVGLVPEEYHMDKTLIDNALGLVGIGLTFVGLQALAKSGKFADALRKVGKIKPGEFEQAMKELAKAADKYREFPRTKVDPTVVMRNAGLGDEERVQEAERLLAAETGRTTRLTTEQRQAIFAVHDAVSKGVFANEWADLRTIRQILTNTLPEAKKAELRTLLESKGYNPAILDHIARAPLTPQEVDVLVRHGILGRPNIVAQLAEIAAETWGEERLTSFARAANDNNKPIDEIRDVLIKAYRAMGLGPDAAREGAVYVMVRSLVGNAPSSAEIAAAVFRTIDQSAPVRTVEINRLLKRLVQDWLLAEKDVPRVGTSVVEKFGELGVAVETPRGTILPTKATEASAQAGSKSTPETVAHALRNPQAVTSEELRQIRNALTDTRISPSDAMTRLLDACDIRSFDRASYERLVVAVSAGQTYATGRRNALLNALAARFLQAGFEAAWPNTNERLKAVTALLGELPDPTRLSGALDELRSRWGIDSGAVSDLLSRTARSSDVLRNREGLSVLRRFEENIARYGVARVDDCFDESRPFVVDGETITPATIRGWLDRLPDSPDGAVAAPDPLRTRRIVAELERRTPLGRIRAILTENGLTVTRELLGGGNLRTQSRIFTIDEINTVLRGEWRLSPSEFRELEDALRPRVDEATGRRAHTLAAKPQAETASNAALEAAQKVGEEIRSRFNVSAGTGRRVVFVPERPEEMEEANAFLRQMRASLYSAVARDDHGAIRKSPNGKPLLEFDRLRFRQGTDESDIMRRWTESWADNFAETMRYLETTVSKYTEGVRLNALLDRRNAAGGRIDLHAVLTPTERENLLKLSDSFAYIVSEFLDMARANNLLLPEEITAMTRDMRRDLWVLRNQLADPKKFERTRAKIEEVRSVYNNLTVRFPRPFGEAEQRAVLDFAMRAERTGGDISLLKPSAILDTLFPSAKPAVPARRAS